ncbi:MAG: hypothetical protein AVDCRST_MAG51-420, partial [uncultured Ramlibacter sp.]
VRPDQEGIRPGAEGSQGLGPWPVSGLRREQLRPGLRVGRHAGLHVLRPDFGQGVRPARRGGRQAVAHGSGPAHPQVHRRRGTEGPRRPQHRSRRADRPDEPAAQGHAGEAGVFALHQFAADQRRPEPARGDAAAGDVRGSGLGQPAAALLVALLGGVRQPGACVGLGRSGVGQPAARMAGPGPGRQHSLHAAVAAGQGLPAHAAGSGPHPHAAACGRHLHRRVRERAGRFFGPLV